MDPSTSQARQVCQKLAELTKLTELERNVWAEVEFGQPAEIINVHFQWARDPTRHIKTLELQQARLPRLPTLPVYSGDSVVPQEADWLNPDVDGTRVQVTLSDSFLFSTSMFTS